MRSLGLTLAVALGVFAALTFLRDGRAPDVAPIIDAGDPSFGLGSSFEELAFTDLSGTTIDFADWADGRPVALFVRDALCPVSRRYGPETARIASEYAGRGVASLYLNVSPLDTPDDMAEDVARYGLQGPYGVDHSFVIATELGVITTAEVFLFDAERTLRYRGAIDDQYGIRYTKVEARERYLRNALDQLLLGIEVAIPSTAPEGCYLAAEVHGHDGVSVQEHLP